MIKINFHPECDIPRFIEAAEEYSKIWGEYGEAICAAIREKTRFDFRAEEYNAIILDNKPNGSYPLILLSSYSPEKKKSTLIHELMHKVLPRNDAMKKDELENHKVLNLVLYEVWEHLYGKEFADAAVEGEKIWSASYVEAWDWAMAFTAEQRKEEFENYKAAVK